MSDDKRLIFSVTKKDFIIETFRSGGKGGQNQNKVETGVRIKHPESGSVGESRTHRTQLQNKKEAFRRLVDSEKFQNWLRVKCAVMEQGFNDLEEKVDEMMDEKFLKIEFFEP